MYDSNFMSQHNSSLCTRVLLVTPTHIPTCTAIGCFLLLLDVALDKYLVTLAVLINYIALENTIVSAPIKWCLSKYDHP